MTFKHLTFMGLVLVLVSGCGSHSGTATMPSSLPSLPAAQPIPRSPQGANGSFTWTSIASSRTLCNEITSQVGETWSLWFSMVSEGDAVTLSLAEGPPDPLGDGPAIFRGSRDGNAISASRSQVNLGGLACPGDRSITPEVGGVLTATVMGDGISGEYTAVYGTGVNQATFVFSFHASL